MASSALLRTAVRARHSIARALPLGARHLSLARAAALPLSAQPPAALLAAVPRVATSLRLFHTAPAVQKTLSFLLADIGEGIAEAEILQW
jgi:hypothetical protein